MSSILGMVNVWHATAGAEDYGFVTARLPQPPDRVMNARYSDETQGC
jgi:hypothetical protein